MRFLKRVLTAVFIYIGVFGIIVLIANLCGVEVQDSLISGVCGSAAVELTISGVMKIIEIRGDIKKAKIENERNEF